MIDRLFGSKTRTKLLKLFSEKSEESFYVRQLARQTDEQLNAIRRELANLEHLRIIRAKSIGQKKFYQADTANPIFKSLKDLFLALSGESKKLLLQKFKSIKGLKQIYTSGIFENDKSSSIDALIIGDLNSKSLANIVALLEQLAGQNVKFTHFTPAEYLERTQMSDRFLYNYFQTRHSILVNNFKS